MENSHSVSSSSHYFPPQLSGRCSHRSISIVPHLLFERLSNEPHYIGKLRFLTKPYFHIAISPTSEVGHVTSHPFRIEL